MSLKKKEIVNEIKALRSEFHQNVMDNKLNRSIDNRFSRGDKSVDLTRANSNRFKLKQSQIRTNFNYDKDENEESLMKKSVVS
jgi:hypothetical protein